MLKTWAYVVTAWLPIKMLANCPHNTRAGQERLGQESCVNPEKIPRLKETFVYPMETSLASDFSP